jgi:hypothetical protein
MIVLGTRLHKVFTPTFLVKALLPDNASTSATLLVFVSSFMDFQILEVINCDMGSALLPEFRPLD